MSPELGRSATESRGTDWPTHAADMTFSLTDPFLRGRECPCREESKRLNDVRLPGVRLMVPQP